jgi:hypothetical protein
LIFACVYLTGQLKLILQNHPLAGVVLVVLNPHVFNLTGQLELKPSEFPTLAATELVTAAALLAPTISFSGLPHPKIESTATTIVSATLVHRK